ncbi:Uncharacterised protein [Mycobacteroides abscessus subsp. abscessus]|nr:Uncharacterised protein [Mycobacteroides abscessus subsp. abscessus]
MEVDGHRVGLFDTTQQLPVLCAEDQAATRAGIHVYPDTVRPGNRGGFLERVNRSEIRCPGGEHQREHRCARMIGVPQDSGERLGPQPPGIIGGYLDDGGGAQSEQPECLLYREVCLPGAQHPPGTGLGRQPPARDIPSGLAREQVPRQQQRLQIRLGTSAGEGAVRLGAVSHSGAQVFHHLLFDRGGSRCLVKRVHRLVERTDQHLGGQRRQRGWAM